MDQRLLAIAESLHTQSGINPLWGLVAVFAIFLIWRVYVYEMNIKRRKFEEEIQELEKLFRRKK